MADAMTTAAASAISPMRLNEEGAAVTLGAAEEAAATTQAPAATTASSSGDSGTTAAPASPARKKPTFSKRAKMTQAVARGQVGRVRVLEAEMAAEMREAHPGAYHAMLRYYASMAAVYQNDGDDVILDFLLSRLPPGTRVNSLTPAEAAAAEEARALMGSIGGEDGMVPKTKAGDELIEYLQCPVYQAVDWRRAQRTARLLARPDDPADPPLRHKEFAGQRRLLHDACREGLGSVAKLLVAPPHAVPVVGNMNHKALSPLDTALEHNRPGVVRVLCQHLREKYGEAGWALWADDPTGDLTGQKWTAAYICIVHDSLEALQALLKEMPDADAFFASRAPANFDCQHRTPLEMAASNLSLKCLRWLVEEHDALPAAAAAGALSVLLHTIVLRTADEDKSLEAVKYLVEECGLDTGGLRFGQTVAELAEECGLTRIHEYLTRGKRAAAANEAAEALLAELEAEEERKARKQQKKKGKKKKGATAAEAEADAADAAVEQATARAAAMAVAAGGGEDEEEEEDMGDAGEAEINPEEPTAASVVGEDRKIPAPAPAPTAAGAGPDVAPAKKKRERKRKPKAPPTSATTTATTSTAVPIPIPESEDAGQAKAAVAAMPARSPPTAAGDCDAFQSPPCPSATPSPASSKPPHKKAQDPREAAFLLKHARSEDKCPLSGALLTDPVIASDGITYDRAALEAFAAAAEAAGKPLLSPITGQPIAAVFFPNQNVKRLVVSALETLRAEWRRPGRR